MHWQRTCGGLIRSVAFSFSLLLAGFAAGQDYVRLASEVDQAKTPSEAAEIVSASSDALKDPAVKSLVDVAAHDKPNGGSLAKLQAAIDVRARIQGGVPNEAAAGQISTIVSGRLYKGSGTRTDSNWVGNSMSKLGKLLPKFRLPEQSDSKQGSSPAESGGMAPVNLSWLGPVLWVIMGLVLLGLIYYVISVFRFKAGLKRKTKTVLEEDEPERSLDEWLELANRLEAEGKFRETIRCLYLACLMRFDEAGVARFVRSETNWEHLRRIQASPKNPDLDFLALTRRFDHAWYGYRAKTAADVEPFRTGYQSVAEALGKSG
jgi:hypothetical protein